MNHNPFATRFTAPGRLPYLVPGEWSVWSARLHARWDELGRRSAIIGPHGCGKSTLLAALRASWSAAYAYNFSVISLHDGERRLPKTFWQRRVQPDAIVVIDGYEQLGWFERWRLSRMPRQRQCGLLVTAHEPPNMPTLHSMKPSYAIFAAVVRRLLEPASDPLAAQAFLKKQALAAWNESGENAREAIFRLYDRWEEGATSVRLSTDDYNGHQDAIGKRGVPRSPN